MGENVFTLRLDISISLCYMQEDCDCCENDIHINNPSLNSVSSRRTLIRHIWDLECAFLFSDKSHCWWAEQSKLYLVAARSALNASVCTKSGNLFCNVRCSVTGYRLCIRKLPIANVVRNMWRIFFSALFYLPRGFGQRTFMSNNGFGLLPLTKRLKVIHASCLVAEQGDPYVCSAQYFTYVNNDNLLECFRICGWFSFWFFRRWRATCLMIDFR